MCMQRHPHARKDALMHAKSPSHAQKHACTCINPHAQKQARHCIWILAHAQTRLCAHKNARVRK